MRWVGLLCLFGCSLSPSQSTWSDQAATRQESKAWVPIHVDATLFAFNDRSGKFDPTITRIKDIGSPRLDGANMSVSFGDDFRFVEYMASTQDWIWVHSVEAPRFVKRTSVHSTGPTTPRENNLLLNQRHATAIGTLDPVRLAKLNLPAHTARTHGVCPELTLERNGRLVPAPSQDIATPAQNERFATTFGAFVVNEDLRFRSRHCLDTSTATTRGIDTLVAQNSSLPRDAYVLGAGSAPMQVGPHSAFLFLLASKYRTVYVNDLQDRRLSSETPQALHAKFCTGSPPSDPDMLSVCSAVPTPPENLDFSFMRRPASEIPVPQHADIFVMYPNPQFLRGAGPVASLSDTLAHLLSGEGNVAYVASELNNEIPIWRPRFVYEFNLVEPTGSVYLGADSHGQDRIFPHATFWTLSGRQIDIMSVHLADKPETSLYVLELNTWHTSH
jgi:hypothetical protein